MVNLICYNLKETDIYFFIFNQNQNFIKITSFIFSNVSVIKRAERRALCLFASENKGHTQIVGYLNTDWEGSPIDSAIHLWVLCTCWRKTDILEK